MSDPTTHTYSTLPHRDVTVRLAGSGDQPALLRLASLDSAGMPAGPVVVAETGGQLVAAVAVEGGATIADPFHRTSALVQMLELRAAQLRATAPRSPAGSLRGRLAGAFGDSRPVPYLP